MNNEEMMQDVKTMLDVGACLSVPRLAVGTPYIAIPDDYSVTSLEYLMPAPSRKKAEVEVTDSDSFIYYTKKHGSLDECTIYAEIDSEKYKLSLEGVINDHGAAADARQWRDHRCTFNAKNSVEWRRWNGANKSVFGQVEFATFLEDNLPDIASVPNMPSGTDILQMALGFEANKDKRLQSKITLQNGGTQFTFVDDEDKDTRTKMQVFERFTLGIPVFDGSANAYPLEARLKYREKDGRLTFWFELIRPDRVFKSAVNDELTRIKDATGFAIISGTP